MNFNLDINSIPSQPGVYFWKLDEVILYIGKANNLKKRIGQYTKGSINSYKTESLMSKANNIDYIITKNEKESLILERKLIKENKPKYNIQLMDDKRLPYIEVSLKEKLNIKIIYKVKDVKQDYKIIFGPFAQGNAAWNMLRFLESSYLYKEGLPIKNETKENWENKYNEIHNLLKGKKQGFIKKLINQMNTYADQENYELASNIKKTLDALSIDLNSQNISLDNNEDIDVFYFNIHEGHLSIALLFYRNGDLLSKTNYVLEIKTNEENAISEFITQYYNFKKMPNKIISNKELEFLGIKFLVPKQGKYKKILEIAELNSQANLELKILNHKNKKQQMIESIKWLENILNKDITTLMIVDNSHTNNSYPVSMILIYKEGVYFTSRKYNLEKRDRSADVDYMEQSVAKYFKNKDNIIPDLIMVDGGIAQINAVKKIVNNIQVIGLVKNKKHITENICIDTNQKINFPNIKIHNYFKGLQYEVDKRAKTYHRLKVSKSLDGFLTNVPGIGQVTEKKLLNHFKTYSNIYNATLEELEFVISRNLAMSIKKSLGEKT